MERKMYRYHERKKSRPIGNYIKILNVAKIICEEQS